MIKFLSRKSRIVGLGLVLALLLVALIIAVPGCQPAAPQGQSTITYTVSPDAEIVSINLYMGTVAKMTSPVIKCDITVKNISASKIGFEPIIRVDDGPEFAGGAIGKLVEPGKSLKISGWAPAIAFPQKIELTIVSTTWK